MPQNAINFIDFKNFDRGNPPPRSFVDIHILHFNLVSDKAYRIQYDYCFLLRLTKVLIEVRYGFYAFVEVE